jgi:hypothetical protein
MVQQSFGIPAAAGYPQYSGNFIHPMVSMKLIEDFYCTSVFGEISSTEYAGEFSKGGDQITFWRAPEVIVRDYTKNGPLKTDTLESKPVTITVDRAKYFSFKMDHIDQFQIQNWDAIKSATMENATRAMVDCIDKELLGSIFADAHPKNQGPNAGCQCGRVDLGEFGAPVVLTPESFLVKLTELSLVLDEQCVPQEGRYIVLPPCFKPLIFNGDLSCVDCSGMGESMYLNGRLPGSLVGFAVYFSHNVPMVDDSTNRKAWHIPFGLPMATVFATQMEKMREVEGTDCFDTYYQALQVYGFDVIHEKALGHLYATLG